MMRQHPARAVLNNPALAREIVLHVSTPVFPLLTVSRGFAKAVERILIERLVISNPWCYEHVLQRRGTLPWHLIKVLDMRALVSFAHRNTSNGWSFQSVHPTVSMLVGLCVNVKALHLDVRLLGNLAKFADALSLLKSLQHLYLRGVGPSIVASGKIIYGMFGHRSLQSLSLERVALLHTEAIHNHLRDRNVDSKIEAAPLKRLRYITDRFDTTQSTLPSLLFIAKLLPELEHIAITSNNVPRILLSNIISWPAAVSVEHSFPSSRVLLPDCGQLKPSVSVRHVGVHCINAFPSSLSAMLTLYPQARSLSLEGDCSMVRIPAECMTALTKISLSGSAVSTLAPVLPATLTHLELRSAIHPLRLVGLLRQVTKLEVLDVDPREVLLPFWLIHLLSTKYASTLCRIRFGIAVLSEDQDGPWTHFVDSLATCSNLTDVELYLSTSSSTHHPDGHKATQYCALIKQLHPQHPWRVRLYSLARQRSRQQSEVSKSVSWSEAPTVRVFHTHEEVEDDHLLDLGDGDEQEQPEAEHTSTSMDEVKDPSSSSGSSSDACTLSSAA
ncbi:hypothetical protein RI367_004158 [Sorochytrium milnesiophthora]